MSAQDDLKRLGRDMNILARWKFAHPHASHEHKLIASDRIKAGNCPECNQPQATCQCLTRYWKD